MEIHSNHKLLLKATGRDTSPFRLDAVAVTPLDKDLVSLAATDGKILVLRQERGEHCIDKKVLLPSEVLIRRNAVKLVVTRGKITVVDAAGSFTCKPLEGRHPAVERIMEKAVCNGSKYRATVSLDPQLLVRALVAMGKVDEITMFVPRQAGNALVLQAGDAMSQVTALVMPRVTEAEEDLPAHPKPCLACQQQGKSNGQAER